MRLYHYSNQYIKDYINPNLFGHNNYTSGDLKVCGINRSFYYTEADIIPEHRFKHCQYKYIIDIPDNDIYDLRADDLKLIDRYNGNISDILLYIKKHYKGCIYNLGYDIVILFEPITYREVIKLYEA